MKKFNILFITGSRGEWGYIRPLMKLCDQKHINYSLCVTNMHLLPEFGLSKNEIINDGFKIDYEIYMSLDGYNHYSMVKSLGIFLCSFTDILTSSKPDWIILAGDRGEQLMAGIAASYCYIPVAHIQAGELSGNIDGMTRHAIGKYAHLHFASNKDAALRLKKLGEEKFRIHMTGAPQLDELIQGHYTSINQLEEKYSIGLKQNYILILYHPVTEEYSKANEQIKLVLDAIKDTDMLKIIIYPNNDAGSLIIREGIKNNRYGKIHAFSNLKREDYIGLLKNASCLIGNSSSGIIEAPSFKVPVVNIGTRQRDRIRGINVIDVGYNLDEIKNGITKALSKSFKENLEQNCINPYGDGFASQKILQILENTPITDRLLIKNLTY